MGFLRKIFRKYFWLPLMFFLIRNKLPNVRVMDAIQTIEYLLNSKSSCVRFGDGELEILTKTGNPGFQRASEKLRARMHEVLSSRCENLLVCVPAVINYHNIDIYNTRAKTHFRNFVILFRRYLSETLIAGGLYGDTQVTRPYMDTLNKQYSERIFNGFKQLFSEKHILIIEGDKTRFGVGNDLLDQAVTVRRILAPSVNAFDKYEDILKTALETVSKVDQENVDISNLLIIVALGPTAKPLVYDLSLLGYRVIDIGHLDVEYEWFLRSAKKKISIPGKYVNEAKDGNVWTENLHFDLEHYSKEIVARVDN